MTKYESPIEDNPNKLGGELVFRGTRVPISLLEEYLYEGYTIETFAGIYQIDVDLVREAHAIMNLE